MDISIFRESCYSYWHKTCIWSKNTACYANSASRSLHCLPSSHFVAIEPILYWILELFQWIGKFVAIGISSLAVSLKEVTHSVPYSVSKICIFLESPSSFQTTDPSLSLKIPLVCKLTSSRFPSLSIFPVNFSKSHNTVSGHKLNHFLFYSVPYTF